MINAHKCSFEWFIAGNSVFRSWAGAKDELMATSSSRGRKAKPSGHGESFWQEMSGLRTELASHKRKQRCWIKPRKIKRLLAAQAAMVATRVAHEKWGSGRDLKSRKESWQKTTRDASCHSRGASRGHEQETRIPEGCSPMRGVRGRDASNCWWKKKKEHSRRESGKSRRELAFRGQKAGHSCGLYKDRGERKHEWKPHFQIYFLSLHFSRFFFPFLLLLSRFTLHVTID